MHLEWVKSIVRVELATSPLSPLLFSCNFLFNKFLNAPFLMSRFFLNQNHNVIYMFRASHVNSKRAQVGFNIFIVRSNHDEGRPLRLILGRWKVDQPSLPLRRLSMVCMLRTYAAADANFMQPPASTFVESSSRI